MLERVPPLCQQLKVTPEPLGLDRSRVIENRVIDAAPGLPPELHRHLVAVVVGLVGALDLDAEVVGLLLGQLGQLDAERGEVQPGDLLVEVLGQRVDAPRTRRAW